MTEIIIKSKIKDVVKLRVSVDLAEKLNKKVEEILKEAEERAKANHRTTILPQDI
jgi:histone H3/H4